MAALETTIDVGYDAVTMPNDDLWREARWPGDDGWLGNDDWPGGDGCPGGGWKDHAVCKGRTALFFPPRAERPQARARRERHALRLCGQCPVSAACQQSARANHEYGFWGGESEEERHLAGYTVSAPIGIRARFANT